ncbi:MAG: sulfur carrier protein ThiS adenylyltransferase ThiF [Butyricicoccus sp.]
MILTKEQLHDALVERHGADIQAKLDKACVGIAGLGGLGSNLAIFLARLGVGHLILVDFDVVDITNLNRQHYTMKDLGIPKTLALVEQLEAINPYLTYETYTERVVPSNVERLFSGCDVVVEAFDKPDQKAMLLELFRLPEKRIGRPAVNKTLILPASTARPDVLLGTRNHLLCSFANRNGEQKPASSPHYSSAEESLTA